jgi:hypothetical protein
METRRKHRIAKIIALVIPVMVILVAGMGWAVLLLWNWLMPAIFALPAITFWQAIGLLVLSGILFRGFRPNFSRGRWRHGMRERWGRMTPEEREEFMKGLRSRWAGTSSPEPDPKA